MTPIQKSAEALHDLAVKMFGLHSSNPKLRAFGVPGLPLHVSAANDVLVFVRHTQSVNRARAAVARCRAAPRPKRPKPKVMKT